MNFSYFRKVDLLHTNNILDKIDTISNLDLGVNPTRIYPALKNYYIFIVLNRTQIQSITAA